MLKLVIPPELKFKKIICLLRKGSASHSRCGHAIISCLQGFDKVYVRGRLGRISALQILTREVSKLCCLKLHNLFIYLSEVFLKDTLNRN